MDGTCQWTNRLVHAISEGTSNLTRVSIHIEVTHGGNIGVGLYFVSCVCCYIVTFQPSKKKQIHVKVNNETTAKQNEKRIISSNKNYKYV